MEVDASTMMTGLVSVFTAIGGYTSGRLSGRSSASQIAADTVDMLQAQIEILSVDKEARDAELTALRHRVSMLENLVTQRAEVAELSDKVSLVKVTVDRIAERVGAA